MTTLLPANVKVHLALGYIDMRKGIDGLAMLVQGVLHQDPFTGHLFVFRGRTRANLIKIIYWDGTGALPVHKTARARRLPVAAEPQCR
jgi:transposase